MDLERLCPGAQRGRCGGSARLVYWAWGVFGWGLAHLCGRPLGGTWWNTRVFQWGQMGYFMGIL
jgi:hypothetical protein